MRVHILYNRLYYQTCQLINAAASGSLSNKYPNEAKQLFEDMVMNESYWALRARAPRVTEIHEVDATAALEAKVDGLSRNFDLLMIKKAS